MSELVKVDKKEGDKVVEALVNPQNINYITPCPNLSHDPSFGKDGEIEWMMVYFAGDEDPIYIRPESVSFLTNTSSIKGYLDEMCNMLDHVQAAINKI